jgi:uncharacterized paraquat-inducible protein A
MSCEHLICAQCAGPVSEGRCPSCRVARAQMHHHNHGLGLPLIVAAVIVALLLSLAAMHLAH